MKTKLLFILLFLGYFGFSQTTTLTLPNLANEFKVKLEKNESDNIIVSITDSKKSGVVSIVVIKRGESISTFTDSVFSKIAETEKYYFKFKAEGVEIKITKTQLPTLNTHDLLVAEIIKMDKNSFNNLLKSKMKYVKNKKSFAEYLGDLKNVNDTLYLFPNKLSDLNFRRISNSKIDLYEGTTTLTAIKNISTEEDFYSQFYIAYCNAGNINLIKNEIFTVADFTNFNNDIEYKNATNIAKLEEVFKQATEKASDYDFINNYEIIGADSKSHDYSVSIKNNSTRKYSILKFCNDDYECKITSEISFDIEHSKFKKKIENFIKEFDNSYTMTDTDIAFLYEKIRSYNEKKTVEENSKEFKKELSSIADKLDNMATKYSGVLSVNKEIPVYEYINRSERRTIKEDRKSNKESPKTQEIVKITDAELNEVWLYKEVKDVKFIVNDTTNSITFFNNKVKSINIVGYIKDNPQKKFSVSNINYSLPLRSLNNSTHYIPISANDNNAKGYYICINDLLDYGKSENVLSFSIKNKDYTISPGKNIKIEQRKLMDFFTAIIFSDVLGINSENPNSLLLAEGRIKVPLWLYNFGMVSVFNFLNADFNVSFYNGLDEKSRYIKPVNDGASAAVSEYIINNFDYIKYNNFNAGMSLNFLNIEVKGLNSEWSLAGGLRYYRTGLRYTYVNTGNADVIKSSQLNSLTYEISTNFEIRPQSNFGADINVGLNWLNARGSTENIPIVFNPLNNNDEKTMLRLQGNFYMKLDPFTSNDGIYVRMGGFYHLGSKDFYPQILVGYATNLSSFVNGFKK